VTAGHPGLVTGDGRDWASTGPPLGMLPGARYEVREFAVRPGERLFLYTDGLLEALRADGEEFGQDRLRAAFLAARDLPPDATVAAVVAAARRFTGRDAFDDDATAMVLQLGT
jgi:sigma-B regulation protein RsbU (phosphoserine phosphatase)